MNVEMKISIVTGLPAGQKNRDLVAELLRRVAGGIERGESQGKFDKGFDGVNSWAIRMDPEI